MTSRKMPWFPTLVCAMVCSFWFVVLISKGSLIHLLVDMQGGRKYRRRKIYCTPKKIKRKAGEHAHKKAEFLNTWDISENEATRNIAHYRCYDDENCSDSIRYLWLKLVYSHHSCSVRCGADMIHAARVGATQAIVQACR